jgi:hypothetical protein
MAIEDHPLWPKWKAALENMVQAKEIYDQAVRQHGENSVPARNAKSDYGFALHAYYLIADRIKVASVGRLVVDHQKAGTTRGLEPRPLLR